MEMSVAPASAYARALSGLTGPPADALRRLVVGKNVGHARGECGIQLLVALDFDDNLKTGGDSSERLGERAWSGAQQRPVIVLPEHGFREGRAVVHSAADPYRV